MLVAVLLCCPLFLNAQELQEYEPVKALYLDGGKFYIYNDPEPLTESALLCTAWDAPVSTGWSMITTAVSAAGNLTSAWDLSVTASV